ncbi:hypothetical protein PQO03_16330 [Lentisphaera profundi]|uniref:DUF6788 domain-containing protein n=1 Tax=Lentisphaera profundi TaxID=1658616 RepID=A0ABY7VZR6_9BACT|nr:DUF6788 family protein [Lentisphaera profundi]WDE96822.1 hypothetical protein PQO03_02455 [Lentisphaera profundi]WDE96971.1 hypothetical protein PQO03_03225 [Lentisphaera profundi]WDE98214.1 hypothetical protein PQO03_20570 [Lentisphaera profundi]WDE98678.1 hypothetical protein PQO03_12605 [Lentisphaera profundi]WDE98981.1 hypothetical protein PQO03_14175 [Lentisphaera profundi]
MSKTDQEIKARIERIKQEISELGELRPGSISQQYNVCGNPSCKCKDKQDPQKHGPYHKLSYRRKGKGYTQFIKEADLHNVSEQIHNYKKLKQLTGEWIDLSLELLALQKSV